MIFVILGTQKFQMNRLVRLIDNLAGSGKLDMPVVAQIGQSDYEPVNLKFHRFLDKSEFDRLIAQAELIITHGGVGSIVTAVKYRKPVIVVPRLAKYGEHVDDHQREIAEAFAKKGYALCYNDGDDMEELISVSKCMDFPEYISQTDNISQIINIYLGGI